MPGIKIDPKKLDTITVDLNKENDMTAEEDPLDLEITKLLAERMDEPSVPSEFVDRWVTRASAILDGQEAEKKLGDQGVSLDREETIDLTARSVVGRMMLNQMPPKGVTGQVMVDQLKGLPAFRMQTDKPRNRLMYDIRSGEILRSTVKNTPKARTAAAGRNGPEAMKDAPKDPSVEAPKKTM